MMLAALFGISFAVGALGVPIIGDHGNGEKIPMDVTVKDGYILTVSGQPNTVQPFFRPSSNLYDFDKNLEARKVVNEDACYIRKFTGNYDQAKKVVNDAKARSDATTPVSEEWNIPGKEIPANELEKIVGEKIAEFCSGYKVFWLKENQKARKLQARFINGRWKLGKGGLTYKKNPSSARWNLGKGGLTYKKNPWFGYVKPTFKNGIGAKGGLRYNNGRGFSANLGGGWNRGNGWSASAGLKWNFGK